MISLASDKQINLMLKNGWITSEQAEQGISSQEASQIISSKLEKKNTEQGQKSNYPAAGFSGSPYKKDFVKPDNSKTMYIAYAKDLTVAMLDRLDKDVKVDATTIRAILLDQVRNIKDAIKEFEK